MRIALLLAALLATPALAHAKTGVTLADGTAAPAADVGTAARGLDRSADTLQPLALPESTGVWLSTATLTPCAGEATPLDLSAVVADARQKIAMLSAQEAEIALEAAIRQLPCASAPVAPADLTAAFEVLGEAAQVAGNEGYARFAYDGLLAIEPGYALTSPPGTGFEELFNVVRREKVNQAQSTVGLHHRVDGVLWNGAAVEASSRVPLSVLAGRHLLQWDDAGVTRGAWVDLPEGGAPAAIVRAADRTALLAGGLSDAGARAAIEPLLRSIAEDSALDGVVVIEAAGAFTGYVVTATSAEPWAAAETAIGRSMAPDRLRLTVGAGYALLQLTHYGDVTAAVDVRLIGPLHLRIEGDLALSQPIDGRFSSSVYEDQGKVAVLPGIGAGVVVHPPRGLIQPWGALTAGVWIGALDAEAAAALEAALATGQSVMTDTDRGKLEARHAIDFRGFLDGGLDLIPLGGPLIIRVGAGVGLGLGLSADAPGFQFRTGASVGVRLGTGQRRAKGG